MAVKEIIDFGETKVPLNWTGGEEMTVEQWGQREWDSGNKTGRENGVKAAVVKLKLIAGDRFMLGNDEEARLIRALAEQVAKECK
jgi:hypothetical protein